jgi:hypothetical protein
MEALGTDEKILRLLHIFPVFPWKTRVTAREVRVNRPLFHGFASSTFALVALRSSEKTSPSESGQWNGYGSQR